MQGTALGIRDSAATEVGAAFQVGLAASIGAPGS
jgi:hypothetical protein